MDQRPFVVSRNPIGSLKPVRRRLRKDLPASDYSPFIVELFAFEDLLRYPVKVTSPAVDLTVSRLPTLAHVERSLQEEANPMGGFARDFLRPCSPASTMTACWYEEENFKAQTSLSASPLFGPLGGGFGIRKWAGLGQLLWYPKSQQPPSA